MTTGTTKCILCNSTDVSVVDSIHTKDLVKLYKTRANVSVERFFTDRPVIYYYNCNNCELKFYWPQCIGNGLFYDELQHYRGYYMEEKSEFLEAAKWITKEDDVLEVGCGTGHFTNFIQYKTYTGLEFSEKSIEAAKKRGLCVINQGLEEHAHQNKERYDVVCYFQVLEHVENPDKFIRDSLVCLKSGGKLILAVPSEDSFIKKAINAYLNMPPHHASRWTDVTLNTLGSLYNVSVQQIFHEPLHQKHKLFYAKTKVYHQLNSVFRIKQKLIDLSPVNNFLYAVSVLLSYPLTPFLVKNKKENIGQSVLAVYTKD